MAANLRKAEGSLASSQSQCRSLQQQARLLSTAAWLLVQCLAASRFSSMQSCILV